MFDNVLVGVDGGPGGRDAIALARLLAGPEGRLTLAHVHPDTPIYEHDRARRLLEEERERADLDAELAPIGDISPARGLHVLAERERSELLVVGSSRHGLLRRVAMSDDTRAALDGAPCPVAVAPAGYAETEHGLAQIGVAYNGSPESRSALELARALAQRHGARLLAFEVLRSPAWAVAYGTALPEPPSPEELEEVRERLAALGVEPHVAYGLPAEELSIQSASLSLLVVGSRGYGPLGRLVHGSTTRRLLGSARCPLLVLARAARR